MTLKYFKNLDGTRGVAAIMVVIFHFFCFENSKYLANIATINIYTDFFQHGVSLFFVLSGFVITRILFSTRLKENYLKDFYLKRVLRIFPLYYLFLVVYYLTIYFIENKSIPFSSQLPYYLYFQNFTEFLNIKSEGPGHYWTLAVEEHFYLLWPLFVWLIPMKHFMKLCISIIIGVYIVKFFMLDNGLSINKFTFTRVDQIILGGIVAYYESRNLLKSRKGLFQIVAISTLYIFIMIISIILLNDSFYLELFKYQILGMLSLIIISSLIYSCENKNLINKIMTSRLFQYLGKISYGIYVWHILALKILFHYYLTKNVYLDIIITVLFTILLSHISYFYYERYFLKFKKKLS